jgi:hypothetical protein
MAIAETPIEPVDPNPLPDPMPGSPPVPAPEPVPGDPGPVPSAQADGPVPYYELVLD